MSRPARLKAGLLATATQMASVRGLNGLSIGALATTAGMSKGGVAAHHKSKQDLQLAVIEEAARLDGASFGKMFWNISLPMLRPIIAIALVLRGIDLLNNMSAVNIITQGAPAGHTETLSYFIYRTAFRSFDQGYAASASVLLLIATIILSQVLVRKFFKSGTET